MALLDSILSHIPGYQDALGQVDAIRAKFLAIPATNLANKSVLSFARSKTNDASEAQQIGALQTQAQSIDDQFNSVLAQFSAFDGLRQSGGSTTDLAVAGASLVAAAQRVQSASNALSNAVAPIAKKYGQPAPATTAGAGASVVILAVVGIGMLLLLNRKGRR